MFEIFPFTSFGLALRGLASSLQNDKATAGVKIKHCAKHIHTGDLKMKPFKMMLACAAFASAMILLPETSEAQIRVHVSIGPPPPPRAVVVKSRHHRRGGVRVAGHWRWNGRRHVWIEGRYVAPRRGFVWVDGYWERHRRGWYWVEGYWRRC
jgi:hypothetical protein